MTNGATDLSAAIVTVTWARTAAEEELLLRSLRGAASLGLPIAIADRTARPAFVDRLRQLPNTVVVEVAERGLVAQIKAAFDAAETFAAAQLLYTEPDKALFFDGAAARLLKEASQGTRRALVLAARSATSFATFPAIQQYTESVVNDLAADLVGVTGDYSYGPFVLPTGLVPSIRTLPAHLGWGWRFATFREAHRQGLPLHHVVEDLPCPIEQRQDSGAERTHRIRQLSENLLGLIT